MASLLKSILALALVAMVTACTGAPTLQEEPASEFAAQGLHPVRSSGFAQAYARPGANLPAYRTVNIVDLELDNIELSNTAVAGTLRRDWQMTPERKTALRTTWAASMNRVFSGYTLSASGDKVLRISAELTRVAPGRPTATTIGGALQPAGSSQDVVEIWGEFRLYDQLSGDLLAVIRDNRTMTSVAMSRTGGASIQALFNSWAALLHTRVSGK